MAPTIEILGTERSAYPTRVCHMRFVYTDMVNGALEKSIRYARVLPGALPPDWMQPNADIKLPEFPQGKWDIVDLVPSDVKDEARAINPRRVGLLRLAPWHPLSIDYFELEKVDQHRYVKLRDHVSDTLYFVKHEALMRTAGVPVALMKLADSPPELAAMKTETEVYQVLEGTGIAPRFLAHVTEGGRIVGFLVEYLQDARQPRLSDYKAVADVLGKLHAKGIAHGDAHNGNFLVKPDGTAVMIDFELAWGCDDQAGFAEEMRELQFQLTTY